jgi:pilus assembly protein FimV
VGTKLDLARTYLEMGDSDGTLSTFEEVLQEGDDAQRKEAEQLMRRIA